MGVAQILMVNPPLPDRFEARALTKAFLAGPNMQNKFLTGLLDCYQKYNNILKLMCLFLTPLHNMSRDLKKCPSAFNHEGSREFW